MSRSAAQRWKALGLSNGFVRSLLHAFKGAGSLRNPLFQFSVQRHQKGGRRALAERMLPSFGDFFDIRKER
jgi:hypothetical protein